MKNTEVLILMFIGLLSLVGCCDKKVEDRHAMRSSHFVQTYIVPNDFILDTLTGLDNLVRIRFRGEQISMLHSTDKSRFDSLAKSFNDTSYTKTVIPNSTQAITEALVSAKVVCDKDYNFTHPAGSDLGDMILILATSPYNFIQSNYDEALAHYSYSKLWIDMMLDQRFGYKPIELLLKEVSAETMQMLYPTAYLYFKERPAKAGKYSFFVSLQLADGQEIKHDTQLIF